jgi:hypothetical protein
MLDPWPGDSYEGTSVLAGIKALQSLYPHAIPEYRWAFGIDDVIDTLGYFGPLVLGVPWYDGMYEPDQNGFIHAKGKVVGGHAILARGVSISRAAVLLHNSWGQAWGPLNGDCYISFDDLNKLLHEDGEACVPVTRG